MMGTASFLLAAAALAIGAACVGAADAAPAGKQAPVRVLLVTGGHDFEREPFFRLFDELPGVQVLSGTFTT